MSAYRCRTNLDGFAGVQWPDRFVDTPRVGDYVEGRRANLRPRLRVVEVTHCTLMIDFMINKRGR